MFQIGGKQPARSGMASAAFKRLMQEYKGKHNKYILYMIVLIVRAYNLSKE